MALSHSPLIVTDGLVLCLDAANKKSYSGSGTTWTDRSGNGNNGTLVNGPTFDSGNGGSIDFDGVDDNVNLGNDSSFDLTSEFSLEIFFFGGSGIDSYGGLLNKAGDGNFGNWGIYGDGSNDYIRFGYRSTNGSQVEINASSYSDISTEAWVHYLGVFSGTSLYLYRNGALVSSSGVSASHQTPQTNSYDAAIGRRLANSGYEVDFKVSIAKIYDRALTSAEVLQNYNAIKSRFGL
tara:strand:- start:4 stop:711 length:708 start_codon:yes stop_codon:yes gene_type:complete